MAGKKRTRNGNVKPQSAPQEPQSADQDVAMSEPDAAPKSPIEETPTSKSASRPTTSSTSANHHKLPKLPTNTTITKRPLLHPSLPTPFASSASPKVLYITASSPFIPAVKRVRKLLTQIQKRDKQSAATRAKRKGPVEANGRLKSGDVEREIDEGVRGGGGVGAGAKREMVYMKATGRAIPKALELGVHFQGEDDCVVRVEMGSVKAIDDVEVTGPGGGEGEGEDVPETRIRTVSSVTISVGLK